MNEVFLGVVVDPPAFDERFGFTQVIKDLLSQNFISQLAVEALTVPHRQEKALLGPCLFSLCPKAARLNAKGLGAEPFKPLPQCRRDKL